MEISSIRFRLFCVFLYLFSLVQCYVVKLLDLGSGYDRPHHVFITATFFQYRITRCMAKPSVSPPGILLFQSPDCKLVSSCHYITRAKVCLLYNVNTVKLAMSPSAKI